MNVHHLDVCTMCPYGGRMVAHALVCETNDGLVLVDTGIGLEDVRSPARRLGRGFLAFARPRLREEQTAARQIEGLGHSRSDVRHIVVTHLDVDHAGGIPDFPDARVHVHRAEHAAATSPPTRMERERYRKVHFAHNPKWELHEAGGDTWLGFASVRAVADEVLLIPLFGHTRGHCAVAVRAPAGSGVEWLMHCGDAYFSRGQLEDPPWCPTSLRLFQRIVAVENEKRLANTERLRELRRDASTRVRMFCAHDPSELRAITAASARATSDDARDVSRAAG